MSKSALPPGKQGLYDPRFEHDACGVGFVVNIKGEKSHEIVGIGILNFKLRTKSLQDIKINLPFEINFSALKG